MLFAWVALVVSQTPPSCPAEQQPEWSRASAVKKRELLRHCAPIIATIAPEPTAPPAPLEPPPPPRREWRYRAGVSFGGTSTFSITQFQFPSGFGAGLHGGGFFAFTPRDWFELRMLIDDTFLLTFQGLPFPRASLATGPGVVVWFGPVGVGVTALFGAAVRNYIGFSVAGLGSVRVRFGDQPRHELALEGGMTFGLGFAGGDYLPGFVDGVARVTYTASWGFVERPRSVALPASSGAE